LLQPHFVGGVGRDQAHVRLGVAAAQQHLTLRPLGVVEHAAGDFGQLHQPGFDPGPARPARTAAAVGGQQNVLAQSGFEQAFLGGAVKREGLAVAGFEGDGVIVHDMDS